MKQEDVISNEIHKNSWCVDYDLDYVFGDSKLYRTKSYEYLNEIFQIEGISLDYTKLEPY